ncbi:RNA polymerase factor sigma-54 [Mesorhizobium sp. SB112]|uniref:RNA polymerase factor sigma-54 n=1 Tax=Mesorhizobium sp. SB112 TaxID=3151853 RepID=UPI003267AF6D
MSLAAKLQLRQSQSLVMTPQLMQSIKLLQMTHMELERFVEEEIERNPLVERVDTRDEPILEHTAKEPISEPGADADWFETDNTLSAETMSERFDTSLENVFPDDPGVSERLGPDLTAQWKSAGQSGNGFGDFEMEDMAAAAETLRDHVGAQIAFLTLDRLERLIAIDLMDSLDDAGYFRSSLEDAAERLGVDTGLVEKVLVKCQALDPAGIFARDLAECISLQLVRRNRFDPAMRALVDNLDLLARRDFVSLKRICGVDEEDLLDMLAEIRALDPRPGSAFSGGVAESVTADVEVRATNEGGWAIELNASALPKVLVDQVYFTTVSGAVKNQAEKAFLAECMQNANWLTRSLDQRARTILKVATEIVKQQDAFLMHGIRHLRPLNLRTVADAIGMHESTVSRVTANKYMLTPRGVFELRYFFTASIAGMEGADAHSSTAVRDRIREMIEQEAQSDVLSDDAIVDILKKGGVDIARRTVAKYREGMNIPSSVQRRREKRAVAIAAG